MPKGKKKKKSKKKSENAKQDGQASHSGIITLDKLPGTKMDAILLALSLEGKKQSLHYYHSTYLEQKESVRILRSKLHRVEHDQYSLMRKLMDATDDLSFKLLDMNKLRTEFLKMLELEADGGTLEEERSEIDQLYQRIEELECNYQEWNDKYRDILEYKDSNGESTMELEIQELTNRYKQGQAQRIEQMEKLKSHHEQYLFFTSKRVEKIMQDMEAVACKKEFDKLPKEIVDQMIKNRLLHYQVDETHKESERLDNVLRSLEETHMDYITNGIELDWNFNYSIQHDLDCDYIIQDDYDDYEEEEYEIEEGAEAEWSLLEYEMSTLSTHKTAIPLTREKIQNIPNFYHQVKEIELKQKSLFNVQGSKIELAPSKNALLTAMLQNKMA